MAISDLRSGTDSRARGAVLLSTSGVPKVGKIVRKAVRTFGVPPMLLGLPGDATYANYKEANKALWRLTILPLTGVILGAIADGLKAAMPDLSMGVALDHIPALSEDRERLWTQVSAADFLSTDEKRAMVGIGLEGSACDLNGPSM